MDIKARVRTFILEDLLMVALPTDLADDASLRKLSILDSTGVLELVAFLEQAFGIQVKDGELLPGNLDSVDAIVSYVREKLGFQVAEPQA